MADTAMADTAMADTAMLGTGMAVGAAAPPARKRSPRKKFEVPDGWVARGFTFEVMAR